MEHVWKSSSEELQRISVGLLHYIDTILVCKSKIAVFET